MLLDFATSDNVAVQERALERITLLSHFLAYKPTVEVRCQAPSSQATSPISLHSGAAMLRALGLQGFVPAAHPDPFCCSSCLAQAWDHVGTYMDRLVCYRNIHLLVLGRLLGCLILFQSSSKATAILASHALRFLQQFMRNQASKTIWGSISPHGDVS